MSESDVPDGSRFVDVVRAELKVNGIPLPAWAEAVALEELSRALFPVTHENAVPSYGAIVLQDVAHWAGPRAAVEARDLRIAFALVDGRRTFVLRTCQGGTHLAELRPESATRLELSALAKCLRGIVIQRNSQGEVTVFLDTGSIVTVSGRAWRVQPDVDLFISTAAEIVEGADAAVVRDVLEFCSHVLSPRRIGATLLLPIYEPSGREFQVRTDLTRFELSVQRPHHDKLAHVLGQFDGATLLDRSGGVQATGIHLRYTERAAEYVRETHGTRHTSAARFTYDCAEFLAFVVSSEGQVTVYADGASIAEIETVNASERADALRDGVPEKSDDVLDDEFEIDCPKCGKRCRVGVVTIVGWRDRETGECPVCGAEVYSRMCFSIHVSLAKQRRSAGQAP